jgi:hypothetical protein
MTETPDVLGKWILITGDVNTGKTTLTRNIMEDLCRRGLSSRIVIVDMAPDIPEEIALKKGLKGVGGKLMPAGWEDVVYLAARIRPPRLSSKTEEEALLIAGMNKRGIDGLLDEFQRTERDILFINDMSIYLQAGNATDLLQRIRAAATVVANGYYGQKLGTGVLSIREAAEMELLMGAFPYCVKLPGEFPEEVSSSKT